jgi:DNA replication licensing factor MCM3
VNLGFCFVLKRLLTCYQRNRLQLFRSRLANIFATKLQDEEQIFLAELLESINDGLATDSLFGTSEATNACQVMQDHEELMISDGIVYKI